MSVLSFLPLVLRLISALQESIRAKGLRDDITVLVVDLLPKALAENPSPIAKEPKEKKSFLKQVQTCPILDVDFFTPSLNYLISSFPPESVFPLERRKRRMDLWILT